MIDLHQPRDERGVWERLAAKAEALGRARAEARLRSRRGDPLRWRRPALLWPLFGKER